jgi:hypothetical protein
MYGLKDAPRMFGKHLKKKINELRLPHAPAPRQGARGAGGAAAGGGERAAKEPLRYHEVDESVFIKAAGGVPSRASPSDELDKEPVADVRGVLRHFIDDLTTMSLDPKGDILALAAVGVKLDDIHELGSEPEKVVGLEYTQRGDVMRVGQLTYLVMDELPPPKKSRALSKLDFAEPQEHEIDMSLEHLLRQLVGKLIWLASRTRWDLRAAAGGVARWANKPCRRLINTAATLLHLSAEIPRELAFVPAEKPEMRLYVDASYDDMRCQCVVGWIVQLVDRDTPPQSRENIIAWYSHREARLVRSTAAAELLAMVSGLQRVPLYLRPARLCFGKVPLSVFTDSQALIDQLRKGRCDSEPRLQSRLDYCLAELAALDGQFFYVNTKMQLADCLTKYLPLDIAWPLR